MAIVKSIPAQRVINGELIRTSEVSLVSEKEYKTTGEDCVIVKGMVETAVTLDSTKNDHVVVKAMNKVFLFPDKGKIDDQYDEIVLDKGACVEFRFCLGNWYILSSDGLKYS